MLAIKGMAEILQAANSGSSGSFSDFAMISINNKRLSTATISKRLNELIFSGAITEMVAKSKTGRRIITYKTTEKGKKIMRLIDRLEGALTT